MAGFLLAGSVRLGKTVGGNIFYPVGETDECNVEIKTTSINLPSHEEGTYGQTIDTVAYPESTEITMTVRDMKRENMAMAFLGNDSNIDIAEGTNEMTLTLYSGADIRLPHRNISNLSVGSFIEGVDYLPHLRDGFIRVLKTGNIIDGSEQLIQYNYGNSKGFVIQGVTKNAITVPLMLNGINLSTQAPIEFYAYEAVLVPTNGFNFFGKEFVSLKLQGTLKIPYGKTSPFEYRELEI